MTTKVKKALYKFWDFLWNDDSMLSWLLNILLAFVLIKFIVYPGLGLILQTNYPVVAVVSESMHHEGDFDSWWDNGGSWYEQNNIQKETFAEFPFKNGFNKGDIMVLYGKKAKNIQIGDTIVFISGKPDPIIHRVVIKNEDDPSDPVFTTKGDNYKTNPFPIGSQFHKVNSLVGAIDETQIKESQILGTAFFRIPYLGYIKIGFVELICLDPIKNSLNPLVKRLPCR